MSSSLLTSEDKQEEAFSDNGEDLEDLEKLTEGWPRRIFPSSLKLLWDAANMVKDLDHTTGAKIGSCIHCSNKWSGRNHTKALWHAMEGIRGCKKVPLAWRKLYLGIVLQKSKAATRNEDHLEKTSIFLNEKEQDAS